MADAYIDSNGNPVTEDHAIDGIPWLTYIDLSQRLNSARGSRIGHPDYGLDVTDLIDNYSTTLRQLEIAFERALRGLPGLISVTVTRPVPTDDNVTIRVVGTAGYLPFATDATRPWSIEFSATFG